MGAPERGASGGSCSERNGHASPILGGEDRCQRAGRLSDRSHSRILKPAAAVREVLEPVKWVEVGPAKFAPRPEARPACSTVSDPREQFEDKIDRASELGATIQAGINEYFAGEPVTLRGEFLTDEPPQRRIRLFVESVKQPPARLGVLMGEFVHDLRSTLDQLVWQLALTKVSDPSPRLMFPIHSSEPTDWASIAGDRLRDVPADAVDMIWRAQPFQTERPELTPLAVVHKLWNDDKHRSLLNPVSIPTEPDLSGLEANADDVDEDAELDLEWGAPLVPGMRLVTFRYTPTGPQARGRVSGQTPIEVFFGSIEFRAAAMPGVVAAIRGLVQQFSPFFD